MAAKLLPLVLSVALASPSLPRAQELAWVNGVLGSTVDYSLSAPPFEIYLLGISKTEGPTPIALVDPADPRNLFLGLDLLKLWHLGVVPAGGVATKSYLLPPDVTAVGLKLHAQAMTLPGSVTLIDELSNAVAFRLQLPGTSVATVGKRPKPGVGHTQTALPNGRVLLVGGADAAGTLLGVHETFWPQGQVFVQNPPFAEPRVDHTASLLSDGRVLVAGGRTAAGATDLCSLIDPAAGATVQVAPLPAPRSRHTATTLADGRVLVIGGLAIDDAADPVGTLLSGHLQTAVYDPSSDAWSAGPSFAKGLIGHSAVRLPDGRVLVTGGYELSSLFGFPVKALTDAAWLVDVALGSLTAAAPLPQAIAEHASIVPSADGRAVVLGGERIDPFYLPVYVAGVHRYDPATDAWTALAPLGRARGHHAVVEALGKIVVAGGIAAYDAMLLFETPEQSAEVAPLDLSGWGAPIPLAFARNRASATAFDGGLRVLVTGGPLDLAPLPTAEIVMP